MSGGPTEVAECGRLHSARRSCVALRTHCAVSRSDHLCSRYFTLTLVLVVQQTQARVKRWRKKSMALPRGEY